MEDSLIKDIFKLLDGGEEAVYGYLKEKKLISESLLKKSGALHDKSFLPEDYPYDVKMSREEYEKEKAKLQIELLKWQNWIKKEGKKVVILFEGRDAAGKGGTIKRFTEHLNPRGARVVALDKPSVKESGQWYFQRYTQNLPSSGEIVFFDRSWYNRAGVERVMGFCTDEQYQRFLKDVVRFEAMIQDQDTTLVKFWFSVSPEEQLRRLVARVIDPLKRWKISPIDLRSLPKWDLYTEAKDKMFAASDVLDSRWVIIRSDDKKRARINALKYVLKKFDYPDKNTALVNEVDENVVGPTPVKGNI